MPLAIDLSTSLRRGHRLDDLVAAIYNANKPTTPETHWVEWKSSLDLSSPKGKFTAAKAIIAFSNRDPARALRECDGEAYLVVGVSTDQVLDGAVVYDNADLEGMLKTYVDGPTWDADYVQLHGQHVLVITVAPPKPGDLIHSLVKDYDKYLSGTVFRRGVSKSEPATHRELIELQNRLRQKPPASEADMFTEAIDDGNHSTASRLIRGTVRSVINVCSDTERFPLTFTSREIAEQLTEYVAIADLYLAAAAPLLRLVVDGCRVDSATLNREWTRAVTALAEPRPLPPSKGSLITAGRDDRLDALALLPATLTLYAGTIAAVEHENYTAVKALAVDGKAHWSIWGQGAKVTILEKAGPWEITGTERQFGIALRAAQQEQLTPDLITALARGHFPRVRYPVSAYLHDALHPYFSDRTDNQYTELFDTAEVVYALIASDLAAQRVSYVNEPGLGLFVKHAADNYPFEQSVAAQILSTATEAGENWPPIRAGLFERSTDRMRAAVKSVWDATVQQASRRPY